MDLVSKRLLRPLNLLLMLLCFSEIGFAQDFGDVKAICGDLSASNRAMAKAAGYDVDKLCAELGNAGAQAKIAPQTSAAPVPRMTASSAGTQDAEAAAPMAEPDVRPFGTIYLPMCLAPSRRRPMCLCPRTTCWVLVMSWRFFFMAN